MRFSVALISFITLICGCANAFLAQNALRVPSVQLKAGGFEWEDPTEALDQGVDNPFKSSSLKGEELMASAGRLLGPRLNGSNLYLIGMMGSGKSAVGDIVARSEYAIRFGGSKISSHLRRNGNL